MRQAAVVIIKNRWGEILLLQRVQFPHGLCLPGGKQDEGEEPHETAMRETYEETDIRIALEPEDKIGDCISATGDVLVHIYYKEIHMSGVKTNPDEHVGHMWTTTPLQSLLPLAGNTEKFIKLWQDQTTEAGTSSR